MKITAEEARDLREVKAIETELNMAYQLIREAAKSSNIIELRGDFWAKGGLNKTGEYLDAKQRLEADGFKVDFFWREYQFVDYGVKISW